MTKCYKTVRLALETRIWISELIANRMAALTKESNVLIEEMESILYREMSEKLNGVSLKITPQVTVGSVIELAYRETQKKNYGVDDWNAISSKMEAEISEMKFEIIGADFTPRMSLDIEVLSGLEELRCRLSQGAVRLARLSYIIKLVVFGYKRQMSGELGNDEN